MTDLLLSNGLENILQSISDVRVNQFLRTLIALESQVTQGCNTSGYGQCIMHLWDITVRETS